jgi:hypothetical protein
VSPLSVPSSPSKSHNSNRNHISENTIKSKDESNNSNRNHISENTIKSKDESNNIYNFDKSIGLVSMASQIDKNRNNIDIAEKAHLLGSSVLQLLSFRILICAHLRSQDCLFVIRGIQILSQHACLSNIEGEIPLISKKRKKSDSNGKNDDSEKIKKEFEFKLNSSRIARQCLAYLEKMNVNILRAVRLSLILALTDSTVTITAPTSIHALSNNVRPFNGHRMDPNTR